MARPTGNPTLAPQVVITSPGAGETLYGGQTHSIQWKTLGIPQGARVKIEFLQSGGKTVPLADNLPSPGKYSWRIGSDAYMWKPGEQQLGLFLPGPTQSVEHGKLLETQGRLRLTASYEGGKRSVGESALTLGIATLKITSPKEGDEWRAGETHTVTWQSKGMSRTTTVTVQIDKGGWGGPLVYSKAANTGSRTITIPVELPNYWKDGDDHTLAVTANVPGFSDHELVGRVVIKFRT
jgi:hypothetical protein